VSLHNIHFYVKLIKLAQDAIRVGQFAEFKKDFTSKYRT
jgi:tRNA-guanine family transglycosylase